MGMTKEFSVILCKLLGAKIVHEDPNHPSKDIYDFIADIKDIGHHRIDATHFVEHDASLTRSDYNFFHDSVSFNSTLCKFIYIYIYMFFSHHLCGILSILF